MAVRIRSWLPSRLSKIGGWLNAGILRKLGVRIVLADSLVVGSDWPQRLLYFEKLFEQIADIDGDIVECGCGGGYSLAIFMILSQVGRKPRRIWGFDSFEGLPAPVKEDTGIIELTSVKGALDSSEEIVWVTLRTATAGFGEQDNVFLVKGWFSDTLPQYEGTIALLHLDADLYESTKCALENLWNKVAVGGIIAFDEYQKTDLWPGERKAADEFFEGKSVRIHQDTSGYCYFVKGRGE